MDSVDIDPNNCNFARRWTAPFGDHVQVHQSDSVAWIKAYTGPKIDCFYADSLDADQPGHAEHGLAEVQAALPHLAEDAIILVDDSHWRRGEWVGKGKTAIPWLLSQNWSIRYSGYQTLLGR